MCFGGGGGGGGYAPPPPQQTGATAAEIAEERRQLALIKPYEETTKLDEEKSATKISDQGTDTTSGAKGATS